MRTRRTAFITAALLLCLSPAEGLPAQAGNGSVPASGLLPEEPVILLGMDLAAAFSTLGPPASVQALRGPEPWQDDVVFAYPGGFALFWVGDRVWQLRFGKDYGGPVFGLFPGDDVDKAWSLLGTPYWQDGDSLVWRLPWNGYPVRLRAWVLEKRVVDLYLYRADF